MGTRVDFTSFKYGLMIALSCVVFSACSKSSPPGRDSRETAVTDKDKELKELIAIIAEYQKQTDASGNIVILPGYTPTPLLQENSALSAKDISTNSEEEVFSYEPPPEVDADFSKPEKITGSYLVPLDVTEECQGKEYFPDRPRLKELPLASGFYFFCIRLTHKSSQKQFYVKTPPIEVVVTKNHFKFLSEDCVDPDLADLKAEVEVTMCDGSLGKGTYVAPTDCSEDGQTGCVAVAAYKAAKMANFDAAKIRSGITIAGVAGSIADCSSNGQDTCFLNSANSYDAANLTNLSAGNIKSSVVIAGVTGDYPSATYPLPGASGGVADLASPIDAQIKSATAFEFWDSTGTRIASAGDADITAAKIKDSVDVFGAVGTVVDAGAINAWDLRVGVTVGSTTGALKVNCRNAMNPAIFDSDTMPPGTAATTAGSTNDWWDTIDDNDNDGNANPTALVSTWTADTHCDATNWQDMTNDGGGDTVCDEAADECVFKDKISGLLWSERQSAASNWSAAVGLCDGLNASIFGGHNTDWRLPTQKELTAAAIHGLRDLGYKGGTAGIASNNDDFIAHVDTFFWSASTVSFNTANAWIAYMNDAGIGNIIKTNTAAVVCVR